MYSNVLVLSLFAMGAFGRQYNSEVFYVSPKSYRSVIERSDSSYYAFNVGKSNLTVQAYHCISSKHRGYVCTPLGTPQVLAHGQGSGIKGGRGNIFVDIELRVTNDDNINGFVYAYGDHIPYDEYDNAGFSYFTINKQLISTIIYISIAYIPELGTVLSTLYAFYWPPEEPSVWDQIKDQVTSLIDQKTRDAIDGILKRSIEKTKGRLRKCIQEIENPNITMTTATHYMNVVEDMITFEVEFAFDYFVLPFYTAAIDLKLKFYQFGITNKEKVGLNDEHVYRLLDYMNDTMYDPVYSPNRVADKLCKEKFDRTYATVYPTDIFKALATVRAFCALTVYNNIPTWRSIASNPYQPKKVEVSTVVFSDQFGRLTGEQASIMTVDPIPPPLQPKVVNGKLNQPDLMVVLLTKTNKIGGMRVFYKNGDNAHTGPTIQGNYVIVNFNREKLLNITARGTGQIDALEFVFDSGRVIKAGTPQGDSHTFSLDKHHIVGFFMTGSKRFIDSTQAANFAVSYQLITQV